METITETHTVQRTYDSALSHHNGYISVTDYESSHTSAGILGAGWALRIQHSLMDTETQPLASGFLVKPLI
ncbi:mCG1049959 [Mus musculus]|nr:mCG1049959 [Mus musculus]